jgi:toxin YoeB
LDLTKKRERLAVFHPEFRQDLHYWVEKDRRVALRVLDLVEAVMRDQFKGVAKPEPLKYLLAGAWSRRITEEHRLVYAVTADRIDLPQALPLRIVAGGEGGIRTPGASEGTRDFESRRLNLTPEPLRAAQHFCLYPHSQGRLLKTDTDG